MCRVKKSRAGYGPPTRITVLFGKDETNAANIGGQLDAAKDVCFVSYSEIVLRLFDIFRLPMHMPLHVSALHRCQNNRLSAIVFYEFV